MVSLQKNLAALPRLLFLLLYYFVCTHSVSAQLAIIEFDVPTVKQTTAANRQKLFQTLVKGINKNLSLPLADSTEENWMYAFNAIELLRHKSPWVEAKIYEAFKWVENRSGLFQRSLMELVYDAYPGSFEKEAEKLLNTSADSKCIAIAAEYLLKTKKFKPDSLLQLINDRYAQTPDPVLNILKQRLFASDAVIPSVKELLRHTFFPKAKIVFSFQRKNRNYPGLAIVRDSTGNFVKDAYGNIFSIAQLARSITNVPAYISNGNTPQGIFRMYGMDVSKSIFIGPTANIQLTMPCETSIQHFFNDSTITDSVWTEDWYKKLLPQQWRNYSAFFESYYAGKAGRTEIIAHGTTVDPGYYKGASYYPLTPTLGCLCAKELWDEETGKRKISDQQKLVDAVKKAGGADGYYIVIELDDEQRLVEINDILSFLQ